MNDSIPFSFLFTVFAAIVLFATTIGILWSRRYPSSTAILGDLTIAAGRQYAGLLAAVAALTVLFSTPNVLTVTAPPHGGAILYSWGKVNGSLESGGTSFHAPWQFATPYDSDPQLDSFNCLPVTLAHGSTGCTDISVSWAIPDSAAAENVLTQYHTLQTNQVRTDAVLPALQQALRMVMVGYDPFQPIDLYDLSQQIAYITEQQLGDNSIVLGGLAMTPVHGFDTATQALLAAYNQQLRATEVNNAILAQAELSEATGAIFTQCVNRMNTKARLHPNDPAGFWCSPQGMQVPQG